MSLPGFDRTCQKYAFASQVQLHGFDPKDAIIEMFPREGEFCLREEDILEVIEKQGPSIAIVIFSGVQYYTGQWFPMQSITKAAKAQVRFSPFPPGGLARAPREVSPCLLRVGVQEGLFSHSPVPHQRLLRFLALLIGTTHRIVFVDGTLPTRSEMSLCPFTIGTLTGPYGAATNT
jgi:hypothetical protein